MTGFLACDDVHSNGVFFCGLCPDISQLPWCQEVTAKVKTSALYVKWENTRWITNYLELSGINKFAEQVQNEHNNIIIKIVDGKVFIPKMIKR